MNYSIKNSSNDTKLTKYYCSSKAALYSGVTRFEVLDFCFDFESRASAILLLKFRGREAI